MVSRHPSRHDWSAPDRNGVVREGVTLGGDSVCAVFTDETRLRTHSA